MPAKKSKKPAQFSDLEKMAMRERAGELKAAKDDGEKALLAKVAGMGEPDRSMATALHALMKREAPELVPKTWYGMPAYFQPGRDGKVICFFQSGQKYKTRYCTFGFQDSARLDDGPMWATGFALTEWNAGVEAKITALVKKATR